MATKKERSAWLLSVNHQNRERELVSLIHKYLVSCRGHLTDEDYLDFLDTFIDRISAVARRMDLRHQIAQTSKMNWT